MPVEVKAGAAGSLRSLHQFLARGEPSRRTASPLALRFDLNPPSLSEPQVSLTDGTSRTLSYRLLSLPLYMVEQAERVLDACREDR